MTLSDPARPYLRAAGAGIATGMRTWPALCATIYAARTGRIDPGAGTAATVLRAPATNVVAGLATVGELVVDKLPATPSRRQTAPLLGRSAAGALSGSIIARGYGGSPLTGALVGAAAAFLSTHLFGLARVGIVDRTGLPDFPVALAEDALALTAAYLSANGWATEAQAMNRPPSTVST